MDGEGDAGVADVSDLVYGLWSKVYIRSFCLDLVIHCFLLIRNCCKELQGTEGAKFNAYLSRRVRFPIIEAGNGEISCNHSISVLFVVTSGYLNLCKS